MRDMARRPVPRRTPARNAAARASSKSWSALKAARRAPRPQASAWASRNANPGSALAAGRRARAAARRTQAPELTEAVERHIIEGGSLRSAGQAPGLPCAWTLYRWMRRRPAFARAVREAEAFRDMILTDQALEIIDDMTSASWQADARRLGALRLRAGQLASGARRKPAPAT